MKREDKFVQSHRPYAVDLASLHVDHHPSEPWGTDGYMTREYWACRVGAVWFRRRSGVTVACIGVLWDFQHAEPADAVEFLQAHDDGRYGGNVHGRWDGERYWGEQRPEEIDAHLAILRPMLDNHPDVPPGYDGWWTFR